MKRLLWPVVACGALQAAVIMDDSDFDGVADAYDACPETPFELTVTADGCPEKASQAFTFYLLGLGVTYAIGTYATAQTIESISNEVTAALYRGDFYASILGAYYYRGAYDPNVASYDGGGVSDTLLNVGYTFYPSEGFSITPGAHLKLATADEGLGTGENDYGCSLLANMSLDPASLFAMAGFTYTGDSDTVAYRDIVFGSAGVGYGPDERSYFSISYDYSQAYYEDIADQQSLSLYAGYDLYDTLSLKINYSYGLSDSAAKHNASLMLTKLF